MWNLLADFSEKILEHLFSDEENLPIYNLVKKLKRKEYADSVYAFTSLMNVIVTLQSDYYLSRKDSISILFDHRIRIFSIGYHDVKSKSGVNYQCSIKQAESLVDAFVLRIFLTENNDPLKFEVEETPLFQIGQKVETVIDDYSRKYHRGFVYRIEKHHKQDCFMYFIEENGKKLKKRYFKDNLRAV